MSSVWLVASGFELDNSDNPYILEIVPKMMLWKLHLLSTMAFWGDIYWVLAKTLVHNEG